MELDGWGEAASVDVAFEEDAGRTGRWIDAARPGAVAVAVLVSLLLPWLNARALDHSYSGNAFESVLLWIPPAVGIGVLVAVAIGRARGRESFGRGPEQIVYVVLAGYALIVMVVAELVANWLPSTVLPKAWSRYLLSSEVGVGPWLLLAASLVGGMSMRFERLPSTIAFREIIGWEPSRLAPRGLVIFGFAVCAAARSGLTWVAVEGPMPKSLAGTTVGKELSKHGYDQVDARFSGGELPWINKVSFVVLLVGLAAIVLLLFRPWSHGLVALGAIAGTGAAIAIIYHALVRTTDEVIEQLGRRLLHTDGPVTVSTGPGPWCFALGGALIATGAIAMLYGEVPSPTPALIEELP